jgi:hypothetical protein
MRMPFQYSAAPHTRKHGPRGYESYKTYKDWLRDEFTFRCVYCLERERWYPSGQAAFAVDHSKPQGKVEYAHLVCVYENLLYACNRCNSAKSDELVLNPCSAALAQHLVVREDGTIVGLSSEGKDLIDILGLDLVDPTRTRLYYIRLASLYRRSPDDPEIRSLYFSMFGFPDELPDLGTLRPPENSKPDGVENSCRRQRERGTLPQAY